MLFGADEFPRDYLVMPELEPAPEVQKEPEQPAAQLAIKPEHILGMTAELALKLYATSGARFQGKTLTALMRTHHIPGNNRPEKEKRALLDGILERYNIQPSQTKDGAVVVTAIAEEEMSTLKEQWRAFVEKNLDFVALEPDVLKANGALDPAYEARRLELWVHEGVSIVRLLSAEDIVSQNFEKPLVLVALREYLFAQMITGRKPPAFAPPSTARSSTITNSYLLSTVITYSRHHISNAIRILVILKEARTPAIREEIAVFTQGFASGIANASARLDTRIFGPGSALYKEYTSGENYVNTYAELTSAFGMGDVDISIEACATFWSADRCEQEVKDLRKEGEPRIKLALSATGRNDPTFWEQCVGQNPVLWALLHTTLRTDHAGATVFRPVFFRDMGEFGYDALDTHGGAIVSTVAPRSSASPSDALVLSGQKRSAYAAGLLAPAVPVQAALSAEELAGAQEARRAAGAVAMKSLMEAGKEAAAFLKTILELPEALRGSLMELHEAAMAKLNAQLADVAAPSSRTSSPVAPSSPIGAALAALA